MAEYRGFPPYVLTLRDIARLEKLRDERNAAIERLSSGDEESVLAWRTACKRYNDEFTKARNGLLALARKALEQPGELAALRAELARMKERV